MGFPEKAKEELIHSVTTFGHPIFYTLAILFIARTDVRFSIFLTITLFLVEIICGGIKLVFPTDRPVSRRRKTIYEKWDAGSFPSVHAARIAALATAVNIQYTDLMLLGIGMLLTLGVSYSRVRLKHHFTKDVIGGIIIGMGIALATRVVQNGIL